MSKISHVVRLVGSLRPLIVAGALAAAAAVSFGQAHAATLDAVSLPQDLFYAHLASENIQADSEAGDLVNGVLRANLKMIATTDFSALGPEAAAATIRNMAAQTLKNSGRIQPETWSGRFIEYSTLKEGMPEVDQTLKAGKEVATLRAGGHYAAGTQALAVAMERIDADYASTRAGLEAALLSKELKRLVNDKQAPAVLLQKAAVAALLKDGLKPEQLAKVKIDVVAELEKTVSTRLETLAEVCDRVGFFYKGPTKDDKGDAVAMHEVLGNVAESGYFERSVTARLALVAIALAAVNSHSVETDHILKLTAQSDATEVALKNVMDLIDSGKDLHQIGDYAGNAAEKLSRVGVVTDEPANPKL
jgi:hypothetical protein